MRDLSLQCRDHGHRLCVSALVHMERVYQMRRKKGEGFDPALVEAFIKTHEIEIIPFDRDAAEQVAQALATEFPTDDRGSEFTGVRCVS